MFGSAAALELRTRGYAVTLIDRSSPPHADASSTDVSKMIRMDYGSDVFYHELAEASLEGWERWNADWPRRLYHDEGFLVLADGAMRPGGFEYESCRVLTERGYSPVRFDAGALTERFPAWIGDRYAEGYLSPRGGWAESAAVVEQLVRLCRGAGVQSLTASITGLATEGSRVIGVRAGTEIVGADQVVVCVGAWTPVLIPELEGVLRCVAQPVVHFGVDDPTSYRGPHFPPFAADIAGTGWYGFPALADGRVKLGHHGDGRPVHPDRRGSVSADHIDRARAFLRASIPGLADAPTVGPRVCLYCDSFDGDLLIDRDPDREGLTVAAGGSGHGFKFAPVLGGLIADAMEGRTSRWSERLRWRAEGTPRREEARMRETKRASEPIERGNGP